jgi:multidrug efflux system membrane fusion protein
LFKAEYQRDQTEVVAPISGYVAPFSTRVGDFIDVGQDVLAVVDDSAWRIVANLNERHVAMLQSGHKVWFRLGSDPLRFRQGEETAISRAVLREDTGSSVIPYISPDSGWIRLPRRFPVEIRMLDIVETPPLFMGSDADVFVRF